MNSSKSVSLLSRCAALLVQAYSARGSLSVTLVSFLFGICPVGAIHPFSLAFLAGTDAFPFPVFLGTLFSCVFAGETAPVMLALTVCVAIFKAVLRVKKGSVPALAALCAALVCGVILSVSVFGSSARTLLTLSQALSCCACVPLFAFLYSGLTEKAPILGSSHRVVASIACCFTLACAFSTVKTGNFSLGAVWSLALTLFYAYCVAKKYPYRAMASGCAVGFVCALGCTSSVLFAPLGLCGLCAGFLFGGTKYYAVCFSLAVSVLFTVLMGGAGMLVTALLHATLAIPVFAALNLLPKPVLTALVPLPDNENVPQGDESAVIARLEASFSSLSRALTVEETNDVLRPLGSNVRESGLAQTAREYMDFAKLLGSLRIKAEREGVEDTEAASRVVQSLRSMGIQYSRVSVRGVRPTIVEVFDVDVGAMTCSSRDIQREIGKAVGKRLSEPEFTVTGENASLRLSAVNTVRVQYSRTSRAKEGESVNGDSTDVFRDKHTFFALIGDGMGSGSEASVVSKMSCMFLEKLLLLGADRSEALILLNKILIKRQGECFCGLDLLEIDLYDGSATLYKAGGAASYAVRNGKASLLSARSSPLGILEEVSVGKLRLRLKSGDSLVMVSDGAVGETGEEGMCGFLEELFASEPAPGASALALAVGDGSCADDDVSVIAVKIV